MSSRTFPSARRVVSLAFLASLALLGALFVWTAATREYPWVNRDTASGIVNGLKMASGQRLYVDWLQNNPPSWFQLCHVLTLASRALSLHPVATYHLAVLAFSLAGFLLLRRALPAREGPDPFPFVVVAHLVVTVLPNLDPYDFGQREQLFSLLFLPYLFWRLTGGGLSFWVAVYLVALGHFSLMKPGFLAAVVLLEMTLGLRLRIARWLALGMALPLTFLAIHSVDSVRGFLGWLVPLHASGIYDAYGEPGSVFGRWWMGNGPLAVALPVTLLITSLLAWFLRVHPARHLVCGAAILVLTAGSIYTQHKFWSYHYAFLYAQLVFFSAFLLHRVLHELVRPALASLAAAALALTFFGPRLVTQLERFSGEPESLDHPLASRFRALGAATPVLILSTSIDHETSTLLTNVNAVGPWCFNFTVPGMARLDGIGPRHRAFVRYTESLRRLIAREKPALVAFSPSRQALPKGVTMHGIFQEEYGLLDGQPYREEPPTRTGWRLYRRAP